MKKSPAPIDDTSSADFEKSEADLQRREFLKQLSAASSTSLMPGVWISAVTLLSTVFKSSNADAQFTAHSMWRSPSSTLWTWGQNTNGELGIGTSGTGKSSPVYLRGSWAQVCSGKLFSTAIKKNRTLWVWGKNDYGQLGQGDLVSRSSPVQVPGSWTQVAAGHEHCLGIQTDGSLWAWGFNTEGELGIGLVGHKSSPVQVGTLTDWAQVSAGWGHSLAIKTDGRLWGWGWNLYGQVGNSTLTDQASPVMIGAATNWKQVSAGEVHSLAVTTDGKLFAWGWQCWGQVGDGSVANAGNKKSAPVQIGALTNWTEVVGRYNHSLAVKSDGTVWVWGSNVYGELGLGTSHPSVVTSSPVQIPGLSNCVKVGAGWQNSFVITTNGTMWAWGKGDFGELGDNTTISKSSPVQVAGSWFQLSGGELHTIAIKSK